MATITLWKKEEDSQLNWINPKRLAKKKEKQYSDDNWKKYHLLTIISFTMTTSGFDWIREIKHRLIFKSQEPWNHR